jgi:hypothetical protein
MKTVKWMLWFTAISATILAAKIPVFAADTDALVVTESGKVGIGTTTPQNTIHVHDPASS